MLYELINSHRNSAKVRAYVKVPGQPKQLIRTLVMPAFTSVGFIIAGYGANAVVSIESKPVGVVTLHKPDEEKKAGEKAANV